jgi:hypothetical protein
MTKEEVLFCKKEPKNLFYSGTLALAMPVAQAQAQAQYNKSVFDVADGLPFTAEKALAA